MINYNKTPLKYTPANNPVVFSVSGSSSDLILFKMSLIEESTLSTVYTGNIFPTPINPSIASINLNNQLSSLVRPDIDNTDVVVIGKTNPIIGYKIACTEYGASGGTIYPLATAATESDTFYAFEAGLDTFNYTKRFTGDTYVMKSGSTNHKFLTLQPQNKLVNDYSFDQLYFLQDGMLAFNVKVDIAGNSYRFLFSGDASTAYILSAATPEIRAKAYVAITGASSVQVYDNIGVYANNNLLGSYAAFGTGFSNSDLAGYLATSLSANSYGYGIQINGNTIGITAPVGNGSAAISLITSAATTGHTTTVVTSGIPATTIISGYTAASHSIPTIISVIEPTRSIILYSAVTVYSTTVDDYTTALVNGFTANTYGYTATKLSSTSFQITAPSILGDTINTYPCYYNYDTFSGMTGIFSGGVTLSTSGSTVPVYVIGNSVTGFTGGSDFIPAVTGYTTEKMIRVQTSPKKLSRNGVTGFTDGGMYKISVEDISGNTLSEERKYIYKDTECNLEYMNVCFTNSIGGIDSYQFVNPQQSVAITKLSIKKNNLNLDADSHNEFITDGVYNTNDEIYKSTTKSTIKVWTKALTDEESNWLVELIYSKNIWIELSDETQVPIQLVMTNYPIQKNKYMKEVNMYHFEFSLSDNYLSALALDGIVINP